MSKDMDKLAAEMKNIKPSKSSRKSGMDAALAAFDKEFAESVEKEGVAEINSQPSQGSADAPRLTGQNTRAGRVQAFGSTTMRKINTIFSFTPKTKMMMGSCAAALMATVFILPLATDSIYAPELEEKFDNISSAMEPAETDIIDTKPAAIPDAPAGSVKPGAHEIIVTGGRREGSESYAAAPSIVGDKTAPGETGGASDSSRRRTRSKSASLTEIGTEKVSADTIDRSFGFETARTEIVTIPAEYETVTETVVVQEAGTELVVVPAEYTWVDGEIEGSSRELTLIPAEYETVQAAVVVQEASTELVTIPATYKPDGSIATPATTQERVIPAVTKMETRRVIKTPTSTVERIVPYEIRDGKTRVSVKPATVDEITVPPITKEVTRRVIKTPARTVERPVKPEQPEPQTGMLTAGDYDDVLNPDLYKIYLDKMLQGQLKGKNLPYVDSNKRINIRVLDRLDKPVALADLSLEYADGEKMFPLRTGADGMAYLYPKFDVLKPGLKIKVSAKGGKPVTTTLSSDLIDNGGDLIVDLDTNRQLVQKLDLLLTIDATGSMGDEMRYLQTELKGIVARVEKANPNVDVRTGVVLYRDKGDEYVVREIPFTDDIDDFRTSFSEQHANGGGDFPEAMHTAMRTGLKMGWRDDAIKVNLLVADAPPHDQHISDTWNEGLISRTRGIHIVPLAASGVDKTAEFLMRSMAQITGGRYMFLTDDSGIGNPHAKPTVDCYVVTRLDGLVTRVVNGLISGQRNEPNDTDIIRSVGNYQSGICAVDQQRAELNKTEIVPVRQR